VETGHSPGIGGVETGHHTALGGDDDRALGRDQAVIEEIVSGPLSGDEVTGLPPPRHAAAARGHHLLTTQLESSDRAGVRDPRQGLMTPLGAH
jgi:hypothetical protein